MKWLMNFKWLCYEEVDIYMFCSLCTGYNKNTSMNESKNAPISKVHPYSPCFKQRTRLLLQNPCFTERLQAKPTKSFQPVGQSSYNSKIYSLACPRGTALVQVWVTNNTYDRTWEFQTLHYFNRSLHLDTNTTHIWWMCTVLPIHWHCILRSMLKGSRNWSSNNKSWPICSITSGQPQKGCKDKGNPGIAGGPCPHIQGALLWKCLSWYNTLYAVHRMIDSLLSYLCEASVYIGKCPKVHDL